VIIQEQMRDAFPYVYAEGRVRYCTGDRKWVSVAYRTKRSITRARNHESELIAAGPANWQNGTITLKGIRSL
jgi:hypothetical protein